MPAVQPLLRAAGLVTAVRTLGQGVVARARALATSGPSSQSAPRTAMSAWGPAEEVDEGVERHGADWQGIKEPYQLALMPSMDTIRPWGHHAIRTKDAFWPWMAQGVIRTTTSRDEVVLVTPWMAASCVGRPKCLFGPSPQRTNERIMGDTRHRRNTAV